MSSDRIAEDVARVREAAAEVYTPEGVDLFMEGRNKALGNLSPLALIAAGGTNEVLNLIEGLAEGVMG